jgi:hypothetical protein
MSRQLLTIGFEIPGFGESNVYFSSSFSIMDADVLLISPDSIRPSGDWVSFSAGGGCYNVGPSKIFEERVYQLKKEILDHLNSGKSVFILLSRKEEFQLAQSVSSARKGQHTYSTRTATNYDILPVSIGTLTSASGKHVKYSGNPVFSIYDKNFGSYLEYQLYIENAKATQIVYFGKDNSKTLGAVYKVGAGHLVVLPMLKFNEVEFTETKGEKDGKEKEYWNKKGLAFGNTLVSCILEIDSRLTDGSEKTLPPEWTTVKQYLIKKEIEIRNSIDKNLKKIAKIKEENERLEVKLAEETKLKDLLFEKGKPLENAVIRALRMLGCQAENYDDGDLEMDQIIITPEKHRYIGECEGKDNKDVDVTKFRQLQDALNADFARDEVDEKAFGILFGNPERLKEPQERKLDFTIKCKSGAEREKIALIKTVDLFTITRYLADNNDEVYKKACRDAIHQHLGKVVLFPKVPENDIQSPTIEG